MDRAARRVAALALLALRVFLVRAAAIFKIRLNWLASLTPSSNGVPLTS
jgi:hypothetical protein